MYSPQFTVELENNPPHELLWACMTATHSISVYGEWTCECNILRSNLTQYWCMFHSSAQTSLLQYECAATMPSIMPHQEMFSVVG